MTPVRVLIASGDPALRGALAELIAGQDHFQVLGSAADFVTARRAVARLKPDVLAIDMQMLPMTGSTLRMTESELLPTRLLLLTADEDELLDLRRHGLPVVFKDRINDLVVALGAVGTTTRSAMI